jgi:hypothetical protein
MSTETTTITGVVEQMLDHAAHGRWEVFVSDTARLLATLG